MVRLAIVIPAYNESEAIVNVVQNISGIKIEGVEILYVVVNDCSKDNTLQVLIDNKLNHIDLPVNLGIGGAVQTGLIWAFENGFDLALQMDGDGQHPADQVFKLIDKWKSESADVVIGSRFIDNQGFQSTFWRRVGISYLRFLARFLVGINITDPTSGFRLFGKRALQLSAEFYPDDYPEPQSLVYFKLKGLKVLETPVIMKSREAGQSSISGFKSIYYMIKVTLAMFFTYMRFKK